MRTVPAAFHPRPPGLLTAALALAFAGCGGAASSPDSSSELDGAAPSDAYRRDEPAANAQESEPADGSPTAGSGESPSAPRGQPDPSEASNPNGLADSCWADSPAPSTANGGVPNLIRSNCGQCHGGQRRSPSDLLDYADLRQSIEAGLIIPCNADNSPLVQRMEDGSMPPPTVDGPRPSASDIDRVRAFIEWGCTPEQLACQRDPGVPGCALVRAEQVLESHCGSCHGEAAGSSRTAGPSDIGDMARLIREGDVIPCLSQASPLITGMQSELDPMPPRTLPCRLQGNFVSSTARPSEASMAIVRDFIDGLCAEPAAGSAEADARAEVETLLGERCGECHGGSVDDYSASDGLYGIDDYEYLLETGKIVPCASDASPLMARILDGSMPPYVSASAPLDAEEIARIAATIDAPCRR